MLSPSPPTMRFMGGEAQSMTRPTVPTKRTERHLAPREISVELNRPPSSQQNSKWPPQNDFFLALTQKRLKPSAMETFTTATHSPQRPTHSGMQAVLCTTHK